MRKFSSEIELKNQIAAAKEYYGGTEKKISDLPPHLVKKYFIKKRNPNISNASNDSSTKDLFEGHQNYKELVNELNYPRGKFKAHRTYKSKFYLRTSYPTVESAVAQFKKEFGSVVIKYEVLPKEEHQWYDKAWVIGYWVLTSGKSLIDLENFLDTWYEDPFYGRVCNKNNLIYTSYYLYRNISGNPKKSICVFDFVATAFDNMKEKYSKIVKSPSSKYLKDLQAVFGPSSTISLEEKYVAHLDSVYDEFVENEGYNLRYSLQTKDYDSFRKTFVDYLINNKKIFTFTGFAESLGSNIYDSYLAFDILETPPSNPDSLKIKFLEDPNYPAYARAARENGFAIDPNKPWRLIADFSSAEFFNAIVQTLAEGKDNLVDIDNYIADVHKNIIPTMESFGSKFVNHLSDLKSIKQKPFSYFDKKTKKTKAEIIDGIYGKVRKELEFFKGLSRSIRIKFNYDFEAGNILDAQGTIEEEVATAINIMKDNYFPFFKKLQEEFNTKKEIINSSTSALSFANTNFNQLTTQNIYENVYYNVYDYMFFSYMPIKIVEFYNRYVEKYPFYGTISFVKYEAAKEKETTSFNKSFRQKHTLEEEKITKKAGIINDLYKREYLRIYAQLRNSENYDKLNLQEMKVLIADLETLFFAAKKTSDVFNEGLAEDLLLAPKKKLKTIENRMIQLTEFAMGTPYTKNKVPGYEKVSKSSIFALKKTWENKKSPNLLRKRLCVSPEDPLVPLPKEPGCGIFPIPLPKHKKGEEDEGEKEKKKGKKGCTTDAECKSGYGCTSTPGNVGKCVPKAFYGSPGAFIGDVGMGSKCTKNEDCIPGLSCQEVSAGNKLCVPISGQVPEGGKCVKDADCKQANGGYGGYVCCGGECHPKYVCPPEPAIDPLKLSKCEHIGFVKDFTEKDKMYLDVGAPYPRFAVSVWQNPNLPGNPHLIRFAYAGNAASKNEVTWHYVTIPTGGADHHDPAALENITTNKLKAYPYEPGMFHHGGKTYSWSTNLFPSDNDPELLKRILCLPPPSTSLTGVPWLDPGGKGKLPMKPASEAELCKAARELLKNIMKINKKDPTKYNGKNIIDMTCKEVKMAMNALQG